MLKVLVADDHPLFREAVVLAVRHLEGTDSQIFEAGTLDEALRLAAAVPDLDLLLLDLRMPGANGLSGLLELRRRFPALPVVILRPLAEGSAWSPLATTAATGETYYQSSLGSVTVMVAGIGAAAGVTAIGVDAALFEFGHSKSAARWARTRFKLPFIPIK